jgi:hypothetical protein
VRNSFTYNIIEDCFLALCYVVYKMAGMACEQAVGLQGVNVLRMYWYVSGVFEIHMLVVSRLTRPLSKDK